MSKKKSARKTNVIIRADALILGALAATGSSLSIDQIIARLRNRGCDENSIPSKPSLQREARKMVQEGLLTCRRSSSWPPQGRSGNVNRYRRTDAGRERTDQNRLVARAIWG